MSLGDCLLVLFNAWSACHVECVVVRKFTGKKSCSNDVIKFSEKREQKFQRLFAAPQHTTTSILL